MVCYLAIATGGSVGAEGTLNAMSMKPLPQNRAIAVRALDNSSRNVALQNAVVAMLKTSGYQVDEDSALVLTLETRTTLNNSSPERRSTFFEFQTGGGRSGGEETNARLNLFDSSEGGVFNPQRNREVYAFSENKVRIDATIDDFDAGGRVWQAWITTDSDTGQQTDFIANALVENLGKAVRRRALGSPAP